MTIEEKTLITNQFLNGLIQGDYQSCSKIAQNYLDCGTHLDLYEKLFKKVLYSIGELWEFNKISVATEHMASAIVETILNEYYVDIVKVNKTNNTIVVSCVENEFHQIGVKMVNDIFELNGWNSYFLGSNTPTKELIEFIKKIKPNLLAVSLSIYFNLPHLETMLKQIKNEFPNLSIIVGGQAFRHGGKEVLLKYDNVIYLPDLKSIQTFVKNLNKNG